MSSRVGERTPVHIAIDPKAMDGPETGLVAHKLMLCQSKQAQTPDECIDTCPSCNYFLNCCPCTRENFDGYCAGLTCHRRRIIYIDGACSKNGTEKATVGYGIAFGAGSDVQKSMSIVDVAEAEHCNSTSNRAELLAAIEGVKFISAWHTANEVCPGNERTKEKAEWIITSDSEHVVKGMTEWLPKRKKRNFKTSNGKTALNLDLFLKLDELVPDKESSGNVLIGFWKIPREYNTIADGLARKGAADVDFIIRAQWTLGQYMMQMSLNEANTEARGSGMTLWGTSVHESDNN